MTTTPSSVDQLRRTNDLIDRRNRLVTEQNELSMAPSLSDGQITRVNDVNRAIDKLDEEIRASRASAEAVVRRGGFAGAMEGDDFDRDPLGDPDDTYRGRDNPWDGALNRTRVTPLDTFARAVDAIERVSGMSERSREVATRKLETAYRDEAAMPAGGVRVADVVLATTDPDYVAGFARWWRGEVDLCSTEERAALRRVTDLSRAMSVGTPAAGGFLVPESLDPNLIIDDNGAVSPVRQLSKVKTVATRSATFILSSAITGSWDGEAAQVSDDTPTLAEQEIVAHKHQTFIPFSIELELTVANLTSELATLFVDDKNTAEAAAFVTGSGTNEPNGFVTALTGGSSIVASATTDTFAIGDVYALFEAVPVRYRDRATWMGSIQTLNDIRQFAAADSHALWARLAENTPEQLLGRPAMECSAMDSTITALANNYTLVLADWQNLYGIVDRVGLVIERVDHLFGANGRPTGQRGAYGFSMSGGDVLVDRAARLLNVT